jgi:hypothetical protein
MVNITGDYLNFYLDGRAEERMVKRLRRDISLPDLVTKIVDGTPFRAALAEVSEAAVAPLKRGTAHRTWVEKTWIFDNQEAITASGGDSSVAVAAYLQGISDEIAYALEAKVADALAEELGDEEEDDDDEEGEEDEDDDEDEPLPGTGR